MPSILLKKTHTDQTPIARTIYRMSKKVKILIRKLVNIQQPENASNDQNTLYTYTYIHIYIYIHTYIYIVTVSKYKYMGISLSTYSYVSICKDA